MSSRSVRAAAALAVGRLLRPSVQHAILLRLLRGRRQSRCRGQPRCVSDGTWGWDYHGCLIPQRVFLQWWPGRYQGGSGAYKIDGPHLLQGNAEHAKSGIRIKSPIRIPQTQNLVEAVSGSGSHFGFRFGHLPICSRTTTRPERAVLPGSDRWCCGRISLVGVVHETGRVYQAEPVNEHVAGGEPQVVVLPVHAQGHLRHRHHLLKVIPDIREGGGAGVVRLDEEGIEIAAYQRAAGAAEQAEAAAQIINGLAPARKPPPLKCKRRETWSWLASPPL